MKFINRIFFWRKKNKKSVIKTSLKAIDAFTKTLEMLKSNIVELDEVMTNNTKSIEVLSRDNDELNKTKMKNHKIIQNIEKLLED